MQLQLQTLRQWDLHDCPSSCVWPFASPLLYIYSEKGPFVYCIVFTEINSVWCVCVEVFWADNPRDLQLLRHDKSLHTIKTKPQLRNVPDYLGLEWWHLFFICCDSVYAVILRVQQSWKIPVYEVMCIYGYWCINRDIWPEMLQCFSKNLTI